MSFVDIGVGVGKKDWFVVYVVFEVFCRMSCMFCVNWLMFVFV